MKRCAVFAATCLVFVGLLAGPAAAAGGLKKFNVDDTANTSAGYGTVLGVLQCNPSDTGPWGYRVTVTVTQGPTSGGNYTDVPCSGNVEHWHTSLEQNGPIYPGKATVCASAEKLFVVSSTGTKVASSLCKTVKFVEVS